MDGYVYVLRMTRQRFIDGIIDHLVNQVMKALFASGPDIHRGAQADGL